MEELASFLSLVWQFRYFILVILAIVIIFLAWGKIVTVITDTKETFRKGEK